MKKILRAALIAVMTLCASVSAMAASSSSVSVKNNDAGSQPVTYTYEAGKTGETAKSITALMTKLSELQKQDSVVQTLTVTSKSADETPVEFKIRISLPSNTSSSVKPEAVKTPSPDEYSALDYYNILITDTKGNVIYSYEEEEDKENEEQLKYKDIPLGVLNMTGNSENRIFNITLSVNKELNKSSVSKNASKLDWSIVSSPCEKETPAPSPTAPAPEATPSSSVTVTEAPKPQMTSEPSSSVNEDKNGVITLSKGEYLCGKDIDEGRYTMTGNGKVHVYTSEGVLKATIALKSKDDKSSNGVDEYVINLSEGEKINVEDETKFTPYSASRTTSSPKATSSAKPKSSPSPKPSSSGKNNPKTGDSAPIIAVTALAIAAAGAFTYIEIKKRKQH